MKALIPNSGLARRMGDLTRERPKCLVSINDRETILGRQLRLLSHAGVNEIIITTGPFEEMIRKYVSSNFPALKVQYVHNPDYMKTNYIYSVYLARGLLKEDLLLLHGDLVFDEHAVRKLIDDKQANKVMANKGPLSEKDFKGRMKDGSIVEIGVNVFGSDCINIQPMYLLSADAMKRWLKEMSIFLRRGAVNAYAEDALNFFVQDIRLKPVYYDKDLCMEIDNASDLKVASKLIR